MRRDFANLVIRAGLAFAFLYPPFSALSSPESWIGYFPHVVRAAAASAGVPDLVLLHGFGVVEVVIALWILSGWKIFWPACAAALMLLAIVVFDSADFEVLFRDLAIASIAVSLAVANNPWQRSAAAM